MFQRGEYPHYDITVETTDGRTLRKEIPLPKGHPHNMMTDAEFLERFHLVADPVLGTEKAARVADMVMNMEAVECAGDIADAMRVEK